jgi:hypothetical protein
MAFCGGHRMVEGLLAGAFSGGYDDLTLGVLVRGWGLWRGQITLGVASGVPLVLAGWRSAPDPVRLGLARDLVAQYERLRPVIERTLFEHYAPYAEAVAAGEESGHGELPRLVHAEEVWEHVSTVRVLVERMSGRETVEVAYRVAWDEEHTLGARFQEWRLTELNGSVRT